MSKKRRSSRARFALGTLLYVLILLLAMSGAVFLLHNYLVIYEDTRPATAMRAYMDGLRGEGFEAFKEQAFAGLDRKLSSEEEKDAFLRGLLDDMSWVEDLAAGSETGKVCRIRAGGKTIGTLRLVPEEEQRMGLHGWRPAGAEYDLSAFYTAREITVPSDCRVLVNGQALGSQYIVERDIPYGRLEQFYEHLEGLPTLTRYESGECLPGAKLQLLDASGREIPEEDWNEDHWLSNCTAEQTETLESFLERFVTLYIRYTADIDMERESYYQDISPLVLPGSPLSLRLLEGVRSSWWNWTAECSLQGMEIHLLSELGEGRFFADLSYETKTVAQGTASYDRYNIRLIVCDTNGVLKASHLFNY